MNNLEEGDRVILKADHPYKTGPENPCEGSEWFCEGVVLECMSNSFSVRWDNEMWNTYRKTYDCLGLAGDTEVCD